MTIRSYIRQTGSQILMASLLGLFAIPACIADPVSAGSGTFSGSALASATQDPGVAHLEQLAKAGRFDEVLARLQSDYPDVQSPGVTSLVKDLERYSQNEQERRAARLEKYEQDLVEIREELDADHVEAALVAAIDAHRLAEDPAALLAHEDVQEAVRLGEERARAAEEAHDWVQALTHYRALDLLFDDYATYRDDVKRASDHLQVLQLYNPQKLRELYEAQLKRRAEQNDEEQPEPIAFEAEPWQTRLQGIEASMLRTTLAQAARKHIDTEGYAPLMRGAIESLKVVLNTEGLEQTFPSFQDQEKLQAFRDGLDLLSEKVAPGKTIHFLETASMIEDVLALNRSTLDLPEEVIVYELSEGATSTLDDFSSVIWPQDKAQFARSTQGRFYGVGIQINSEFDPETGLNQLTVVTPLANTPAREAGIQADDIIAEVDGRPTTGWSLDKAVREITGPEGTQVELGISREGHEELLRFQVTRAEIPIESIRGWKHTGTSGGWSYWIDAAQRIGYVRLSQFIPQTADDLDAAIEQMQQDGPINGLILDLRFNPGGLLSSAIQITDRFIREGAIVFTVNADGDKTSQSQARPHRTYKSFPVVILINEGSASASEIVAGALQDHGRALVVGNRTFGKGSVQDLFPLADGDAYLKLTTQYYMLPMGRIIHRKPDATEWGVGPDLEVPMTNEQMTRAMEYRQEVDVLRGNDAEEGEEAVAAEKLITDGLDPQLAAGLLVLKTHMVAQDIAIAQARAHASEITVP